MYDDAYITLVFGVSRVAWFVFPGSGWLWFRCFHRICWAVCLQVHTQISFCFSGSAKDMTIQSRRRLN